MIRLLFLIECQRPIFSTFSNFFHSTSLRKLIEKNSQNMSTFNFTSKLKTSAIKILMEKRDSNSIIALQKRSSFWSCCLHTCRENHRSFATLIFYETWSYKTNILQKTLRSFILRIHRSVLRSFRRKLKYPYRTSRVDQSWSRVIPALGALSELEQSSPRLGDSELCVFSSQSRTQSMSTLKFALTE